MLAPFYLHAWEIYYEHGIGKDSTNGMLHGGWHKGIVKVPKERQSINTSVICEIFVFQIDARFGFLEHNGKYVSY